MDELNNQQNSSKKKYWIILGVVVVLAVVAYFIFQDVNSGGQEGGTYNLSKAGSRIVFPKGSIPSDIENVGALTWSWWGSSPDTKPSDLTAQEYETANRIKQISQQGFIYGIGGFYQLTPSGAKLDQNATLTIVYSDNELEGNDENKIVFIYEDAEVGGLFEMEGGVLDTTKNTVTIEIDELKLYTLGISQK